MAKKISTAGTRRSTFNKRRKGILAVLVPWFKRFGVAVVILIVTAWFCSWLVLSGAAGRSKDWVDNKIVTASRDMGFQVENIMVEGRQYADAATLLAIVNVQKGDPLFSFNPKEAQDLIAQIGWVEAVRVERRWPDTIYIHIKEREPLALWQDQQTLKLVDSKGGVIPTGGLARFKTLKIIMGENAPVHAPALIKNLQGEPELAQRVEAAKWIGDRRWDLVLDNGIVVKMPERDFEAAYSHLAREQSQSALLEKDIESIDLREAGRLIVKTTPGAVKEYKASFNTDVQGNNI